MENLQPPDSASEGDSKRAFARVAGDSKKKDAVFKLLEDELTETK